MNMQIPNASNELTARRPQRTGMYSKYSIPLSSLLRPIGIPHGPLRLADLVQGLCLSLGLLRRQFCA